MNRLVRGELLAKALEKAVERENDEGVDVGCTESSCVFIKCNKIMASWSQEEFETYKQYQTRSTALRILIGMGGLSYSK